MTENSEDDTTDAERLEAAAELLDSVDAEALPNPHDSRVRRWRDQARSAATSAGGNGNEE